MKRAAPVLHRSAFFALSLFVPLAAEPAMELVVKPRYEAGDRYRLSLSVTTHTEAVAGRGERGFEEKVRVDYAADVLVLEVDAQGLPLRERHENVELRFERPEETGSLFSSDVRYEVRREDSAIGIFVGDARVDRKVEKVVADVLGHQFEHTLAPALLDPEDAVAVGDTWEPDRSLAEELLRARGIRALELSDAPSATLARLEQDDGIAIRSRIPVAWLTLDPMPETDRVAESEAELELEVRLPAGPNAPVLSYSSELSLRMRGSPVGRSGWTRALPWRLERFERAEQTTVRLQGGANPVSLDPRPAAPASPDPFSAERP